jgi:hypothetical protein
VHVSAVVPAFVFACKNLLPAADRAMLCRVSHSQIDDIEGRETHNLAYDFLSAFAQVCMHGCSHACVFFLGTRGGCVYVTMILVQKNPKLRKFDDN